MIEDAYNTLNEEGRFITSGIIEEKSDEITEHMKRAGFNIISINHDNGWVCIVGESETINMQRYFINQNADENQRFL